MLFESLTGQPPFATHEEKVAKIYAHLQEPAPPLLARGRQLPEALDAVVARALEKEPNQRYPSAGDLARAARAALDLRPVTVAEHTVAVGAAAPDSDPAIAAGETQAAEPPSAASMEALRRGGRRALPRDRPRRRRRASGSRGRQEAAAPAQAPGDDRGNPDRQAGAGDAEKAKRRRLEKKARKAAARGRKLSTPAAIILALATTRPRSRPSRR